MKFLFLIHFPLQSVFFFYFNLNGFCVTDTHEWLMNHLFIVSWRNFYFLCCAVFILHYSRPNYRLDLIERKRVAPGRRKNEKISFFWLRSFVVARSKRASDPHYVIRPIENTNKHSAFSNFFDLLCKEKNVDSE